MNLEIFDRNYAFIKKSIYTNTGLHKYFIAVRKNRYVFNLKYKKQVIKKSLKLLQTLTFLKAKFMILCEFKYVYDLIRGKNLLMKKSWMPGHILKMHFERRKTKKLDKQNKVKKLFKEQKQFFTVMVNLWNQDAEIPILECKKLLIPTFSFTGILNKSFNHSDYSIPVNQKIINHNYMIHKLIIIHLLEKTTVSFKYYVLNNFFEIHNILKIGKNKKNIRYYMKGNYNYILNNTRRKLKNIKLFKKIVARGQLKTIKND